MGFGIVEGDTSSLDLSYDDKLGYYCSALVYIYGKLLYLDIAAA